MREFLKKRNNQIILIIILLLILVLGWFNFYYYSNCSEKVCFYKALKECKKTTFISDENMTFKYTIFGREKDSCVVNVKLLDAALPEKDLRKVINKQMQCSLPYQVLMVPESDIGLCRGDLKEAFQDLIINRLHIYIVKNLGEINADLLKV